MQAYTIPTCYCPGTTIFLDDSRDFLLNFVLQLDEDVAYQSFSDPQKALDAINNKRSFFDGFNQPSASLPNAFTQTIYNANRFNESAVVVVDYAMPNMDGLSFCRQINNPNIKKILLTGKADEVLATQAFNEGIIHKFVKKNDVNALDIINQSIQDLQLQYFQIMSNIATRHMALPSPHNLQDKRFAQFFYELCQTHAICEYYLLDAHGSFLLLDTEGREKHLMIYPNILPKAHDFPKHITLNSLVGDITYQWYLTDYLANDKAGARKIFSYHQYLEKIDAQALLEESL